MRSLQVVGVVGEQHQCGQRRRTDGVALGHRLGGIAHCIQRIGDVADLRRQLGHLGDATGVVGYRAVGIQGDDHAGHRQHRGGSDGDAVQAAQCERAPDRRAHRHHR
ncbi:hypothetical protein G6F68_016642 [Rhizopus microsporus]|nr:hypothetical protein G6F68_016642 [Rhizopus microsporus]